MIKNGVKNYLVCLKYIFTPLGTMFLGIIIGISVLIPVAQASFAELAEEIKAIVQEVQIDPNRLFENLWESFTSLDWSNPMQALSTIFTREWLEETLIQSLNALIFGKYDYTAQVQIAVENASASLYAGAIFFIIIVAISIVAGYFIVKAQIRSKIAKRAFWKVAIVAVADCIISLALFVLNVWLLGLWTPGVAISSIISFLIMGAVALFEAYLVHGYKKVAVKEVVTTKNVGLLALTNIVIYLIWFAFTAVITLLLNKFAGIAIGLVLFEIAGIVMNLNAESFVKGYAEKTL